MQRIAILGATGSVGVSTLDVLARHPERYEVFGLSAQRRIDELLAQCLRFRPRCAVVPDDSAADRLRQGLAAAGVATEVLVGAQALSALAAAPEVDAVMAAIVGAAGLPPCLAAARAGKRLLLANKEALVVGGAYFMDAVREGGATLLPIDSEHSAIFQCLPEDRSTWAQRIDHIVLTASGGPFRQRAPDSLHDITPEQAVAHPNWVMGRKISVDSATMMNKALEVIEARWLFSLEPERVQVVIHPQSIIHSMVVCRDASVLAQLGTPDMRVPITYGLSYPERIESGAPRLDFLQLAALSFEPVDPQRFPGLQLAWEALRAPAGSTAVLNAANEEAVAAFLDRRIRFTDIHRVNAGTIEALAPRLGPVAGIGDLLALDERARAHARSTIQGLAA
jgi:1-deoxy-D-xylulose-5-phosphate reductoisomerase